MKVRWLTSALRDVEEIYEYVSITKQDADLAKRVIATIRDSVTPLSQFPQMGKPGRLQDTRELIIPRTPFVVVYRVTAQVEILLVHHSAKRWPR